MSGWDPPKPPDPSWPTDTETGPLMAIDGSRPKVLQRRVLKVPVWGWLAGVAGLVMIPGVVSGEDESSDASPTSVSTTVATTPSTTQQPAPTTSEPAPTTVATTPAPTMPTTVVTSAPPTTPAPVPATVPPTPPPTLPPTAPPTNPPTLPPPPPPTAPPAPQPFVPAIDPAPAGNCHPSYPDVCIPQTPPDLDCGEIDHRRFTVVGEDPHGFDGDRDGIGCES